MPRSRFFCLPVLVLGALLSPEAAFAWGPGVHMITGNWILQNLSALPPSLALVLLAHPGQYLHGCLSADIFIGKGSKARKGHSHNWETGFALLARADAPERVAYAHGYLSHLAADTVAHNVFVPGLSYALPGKGRFSHVLLEALADHAVYWDSADALSVFHEKTSGPSARMLRSSMGQGVFPFWFKHSMFRSSIALGGSVMWRRSLNMLEGLMPERELRMLLERMLKLSARAMADVLRYGEGSEILSLDPIGAVALARAESLGYRAKRLHSASARPTQRRAPLRIRVREPEVFSRIPSICKSEHEVLR